MNNIISVVIVTKDRQEELRHCLGTLTCQSELMDELIIIDNNSSDNTLEVVKHFQKNVLFKVKYVKYRGTGFPKIYNRGLKEASSDWIAFIDDDCVADVNWVKEIKNSIKKYPTHAAIMGWCGTYYSKNVYSLATLMFDNIWKQRSIIGNVVVDLEVLDNKNVVYRKKFLQENSLEYDEGRIEFQNGASEDCDLGMQIQNANGKAVCNKKIMIWHSDPRNWRWFINKYIMSWKSYQSLNFKWNLEDREKMKSKQISLITAVSEMGDSLKINFLSKLKLYIVAKQVMFLNRVLPILFRIKNEK